MGPKKDRVQPQKARQDIRDIGRTTFQPIQLKNKGKDNLTVYHSVGTTANNRQS